MASLHKLLSEEGFQRQKSKKPKRRVKFKDRAHHREDSVALPIYICHDRKSLDSSLQRRSEKALSLGGSSVVSSRKGNGSGSERRSDDPAIDDVAIKAMVSILSGFAGQYLKDESCRKGTRGKCRICFEKRKKKHSDGEIFARLEMGIQRIEKLVEIQDIRREMDLESLQEVIKILNIVASLDSTNEPEPGSYLSACANLYLSIVYKMAKNDKISARHLLQVFSESPFLARTHLLPELWEHFFLPHLLHLKIWYSKELDFLTSSGYADKDRKIKALNEKYHAQMDNGTTKFAAYYKEWLKIGSQAPPVPSVPLPSKPSYSRSRRQSSDSSSSYNVVGNKSLYEAVFGPMTKGQSMHQENGNGASKILQELELEHKLFSGEDVKSYNHVQKKAVAHRRSSSLSNRVPKSDLWPETQKSDYFRFLGCRTEPSQYISNFGKIKNEETALLSQPNNITRSITDICLSESLIDCEMAIRTITEAWLNSHGDSKIETSLSQPSVIQGIMEVLYVSNDDEILEIAISILAELATRSEKNRQCMLNSDPQLDVSTRLLRSSSLFLKAAALLYLLKPKAKQMVSMEWVPLVLRVLEFGDQLQILFTVRCYPHEAAYYFLDQLITGFDEDKNLENARQVISLGGLNLLARRLDVGDICEKSRAASALYYCLLADGSCRHYLVKNLKKQTILSLLVLWKEMDRRGCALALLTELLCLSRTKQRMEFLTGLTKGWDCLSTANILLVHLQRARPEERPVIAVVLLQLDLMGDPLEYSVYREEAIDAIVKALEVFDEKIQEVTARALLILGGIFSYKGEPEIEGWLLKKAGLDKNIDKISINSNDEEETRENWLRRSATIFLRSGSMRLIAAFSDSLANSFPCLAHASLVTLCWMSISIQSVGNRELQHAACAVLAPRLMECLKDNNNLEEKILASFSLHNLTKGTDYFSCVSQLEKEVTRSLRKLSRVTWTAKELISVIKSDSPDRFP